MAAISALATFVAMWVIDQASAGLTFVGNGVQFSVVFTSKGIKFCIGLTSSLVGVSGNVYVFQPGQIEGTVGISKYQSVGVALKEGEGITGHVRVGVSVPGVNVGVYLLCSDKEGNVHEGLGLLT